MAKVVTLYNNTLKQVIISSMHAKYRNK